MIVAPPEVARFRTKVAERLGLQLDDGKLEYLGGVLKERLKATGCQTAEAYLQQLASCRGGGEEWRAIAEQLTTTETYFFRYWDHFRAFSEVVLPSLLQRLSAAREVRILSAGCASGEEAYSLAILLREQHPQALGASRIAIHALDVNPSMLRKASMARYSTWALRATPPELRERYFREEGEAYVLDARVRSMINLEERNIIDDAPAFWQAEAFDVVFCRNVIMYFAAAAARAAVARIARSLAPAGFLFLGHAETLRGISDDFHLRHTHGTFYYQKRETEGGEAPRLEVAGHARMQVEPDTSWVETIQKASERIACLAEGRGAGIAVEEPRQVVAAQRRGPRLGLVLDLLRSERFSRAIDAIDSLPPELVADRDVRLLRAAILTNQGHVAAAEKACRELLELDELGAGPHYLIALCREYAGDRAAALDHHQTAVYLDVDFAMPHLHIGLLARRAGDLDTARRELGQARTLLAREDASRILLFGGGFSREALIELCRTELRSCGGMPA